MSGWSGTGHAYAASEEHPELRFVADALPALSMADAAYHAVVANFVLNHVADPRASAAELRRVASDMVVATIWTRSPSWLWREVCDRAGLAPAMGEMLPPEKDFARTAIGFEDMLAEVGWPRPAVTESSWTWHADPNVLRHSVEYGVASAGAFYVGLGAADQERFRVAFDAVCADRAVGGAIPLEHTAALGVARVGE